MTIMTMVLVVVVVLMMVAWSECYLFIFSLLVFFYFNFVFILFFTRATGKAPLIIGIFLVFFFSSLSARITSGTGCFRNMAGSWAKALAKPCRVRAHSSLHLSSMYDGIGTLCIIFFPLTFPLLYYFILFFCARFSFLFIFSLPSSFVSGSVKLIVIQGNIVVVFCSHTAVTLNWKREENILDLD